METVKGNIERQDRATIDKTADGKYYIWVEPVNPTRNGLGLIRKEYKVAGNQLVYPKKWGRRKSSLKLVETIMEDQRMIIQRAQKYLDGLESLHNEIMEWPDDELEQLENRWLGLLKIPKTNNKL